MLDSKLLPLLALYPDCVLEVYLGTGTVGIRKADGKLLGSIVVAGVPVSPEVAIETLGRLADAVVANPPAV